MNTQQTKFNLELRLLFVSFIIFFFFLKIRTSDFSDFDYIIGMDDDNMR